MRRCGKRKKMSNTKLDAMNNQKGEIITTQEHYLATVEKSLEKVRKIEI